MRVFIILILLLTSMGLSAQNESLLPLFDQAKSYFCPALTGDLGETKLFTSGGYQHFSSFAYGMNSKKDKTSLNLGLTTPVYTTERHRISIGGYYAYQQRENMDTTYLHLHSSRINFAYSINNKKGTYSIGAFMDFISFKRDLGINYGGNNISGSFFNPGVGAAYRSRNEKFYFGASSGNLINRNLYTPQFPNKLTLFKTIRHCYLVSGLDIPISHNLTIIPSVNIYLSYYSGIYTYNLMTMYKEKYLFGFENIMKGSNNTGGFRLGYKYGLFSFNYSYLTQWDKSKVSAFGQHTLGIIFINNK